MQFAVRPLRIEGLRLIEPRVFYDQRGSFLETWNRRDFEAVGLGPDFVQDNQSKSFKGVIRGLHFQRRRPQAKLIRALMGELYSVAVDLRHGSPTFGRWEGVMLAGSTHALFYVPAGFAHGFVSLSAEVLVAYRCTDYYDPSDEDGIRWDDPRLAIDWPLDGAPPILSAKDAGLPPFDPARVYFGPRGEPA